MALDSKQKRGSAIGILSTWRNWLTEPTGTIDTTARQSLLKLCSTPSAGTPPTFHPWYDLPAANYGAIT